PSAARSRARDASRALPGGVRLAVGENLQGRPRRVTVLDAVALDALDELAATAVKTRVVQPRDPPVDRGEPQEERRAARLRPVGDGCARLIDADLRVPDLGARPA